MFFGSDFLGNLINEFLAFPSSVGQTDSAVRDFEYRISNYCCHLNNSRCWPNSLLVQFQWFGQCLTGENLEGMCGVWVRYSVGLREFLKFALAGRFLKDYLFHTRRLRLLGCIFLYLYGENLDVEQTHSSSLLRQMSKKLGFFFRAWKLICHQSPGG